MSSTYIVPPCPTDPTVLYRDDDLLLVEKPAGLLSVPGRHPLNRDSLITRLQEAFPQARTVHRLDLDTSGVMVVALHAASQRALNRLFTQRRVEKHYQAIVQGRVDCEEGSIDLPLSCDWPNRPRQKVNHERGKPALTHYRRLQVNESDAVTRLRLTPVTGRSHQLRLHLAAIGHPVLGCRFYAPDRVREAAPRLMLHAEFLSFPHPVTGEPLAMNSPVPF